MEVFHGQNDEGRTEYTETMERKHLQNTKEHI